MTVIKVSGALILEGDFMFQFNKMNETYFFWFIKSSVIPLIFNISYIKWIYNMNVIKKSISALDTLIADAMSRDPETKEWKCNYCAKSHKDKARIKRHVEVHFPGHTQLCPYCQKECNSRNSLRVHISDYHQHIHNNLIINNL